MNTDGASQDLLGGDESHGPGQNSSGLIAPLVPTTSHTGSNPMERLDSKSSDVDVFVDAEEK